MSQFGACQCSHATAKLHNAALHSVSASQSQAPFVVATASRPTGESNRRYAKLPTLKRARQPPALPSRFASYVQSPVALVVCWHRGISQALRAGFWSAASPCIWCLPPPTPELACFAASPARSARPPPKGAPSVRALAWLAFAASFVASYAWDTGATGLTACSPAYQSALNILKK